MNIEKSMKECLLEAFQNNAIITSDGLEETEFIHVCEHKAYYEDGCCLGTFSEAYALLNSQNWTHRYKWYIIRYLTEDEIIAIKKLKNKLKPYEIHSYNKELNKILEL